jgi:exopolysaccharide biosynthesis polyprenyl glycosylphosphotransferase
LNDPTGGDRPRVSEAQVLRESIDVEIQPERRAGLRLLPMLGPLSDATALIAVAFIAGFEAITAGYAVVALIALNTDHVRSSRINPRLGDEAGWLVARLAVVLLLFLVPASLAGESASRLLGLAATSIPLVMMGRGITYALQRRGRARGGAERAVIVGLGETGTELARLLQEHAEYGMEPVGLIGRWDGGSVELPVLGQATDLEAVVREFDVSRVFVAFDYEADRDLATVLRSCERLPVEVHVVPRFWELGGYPAGRSVDDVWGVPLILLRRPAFRTPSRGAKRIFDVTAAAALLMLAAPLMLLAAVAVKLSSPGPVLFRQSRVGLDGREFAILKFRTMRVNGESDTQWSVQHDQRVTTVGRLLRRSCVDELPQLLNVLRGDMSLVGARPERPHFVQQFAQAVPRYRDRHRLPVGLTGWAQVHGLRGDTSILERARFDNAYIENWSLWRDVVIVARTIAQILRGQQL